MSSYMSSNMSHDSIKSNSITLGDARELIKLIPDSSADCIITDPPYESLNVAVSTGTTTRLVSRDRCAGNRLASSSSTSPSWFDTINSTELLLFFDECKRVLKSTGSMYIFADVKSGLEIFPNLNPSNVIVWDKGTLGMGYSWRRMHEWIAYCPMKEHKLRSKSLGDIIRVNRVAHKIHPTQKPVELFYPILENSTDVDDLVLDPFIGSGSLAVACVRMNRNFIGFEKSEQHYSNCIKNISYESEQVKLEL